MAMLALQEELTGTDLENLKAFNYTYYIITKNVAGKFGQDYFKHESLMEEFDINFAYYYFNALGDYMTGKKMAPAWKICFDFCRQDKSFQINYMALGVNAHVNNDLALSLHDIIKTEGFKEDFDKVNQVIAESLSEVIAALEEKNPAFNKLKNQFQGQYAVILNGIICRWRAQAWNNYLNLRKKEVVVEQIETKASQMANNLKKIRFF